MKPHFLKAFFAALLLSAPLAQAMMHAPTPDVPETASGKPGTQGPLRVKTPPPHAPESKGVPLTITIKRSQ